MKGTVCGPYITVPFPELESDDVVAEFLPHPLPGAHIQRTMYLSLEFLQTGLIDYVTIKV